MIDANLLQKVGAGRTATIYRYGQNQVVKLYRRGFSKKAIDEDLQIGQALNHVGLDVLKTYELVQLEESKGILFDYIPGQSTLATKPWRVFSYSKQMARLHFRLDHCQHRKSDSGCCPNMAAFKHGSLPENKTAFEIFLARNLRDIFCRGYLQEYKKLSNTLSAEFERWKLPIATARLIEKVDPK
jgi:hypothetical protein